MALEVEPHREVVVDEGVPVLEFAVLPRSTLDPSHHDVAVTAETPIRTAPHSTFPLVIEELTSVVSSYIKYIGYWYHYYVSVPSIITFAEFCIVRTEIPCLLPPG